MKPTVLRSAPCCVLAIAVFFTLVSERNAPEFLLGGIRSIIMGVYLQVLLTSASIHEFSLQKLPDELVQKEMRCQKFLLATGSDMILNLESSYVATSVNI